MRGHGGARVAVGVVALLLVGCTPASGPRPDGGPPGLERSTSPSTTAPAGERAGLLRLERAIDGDSFVADDGVEYRIGMVDAPELGTCGADEAAARTEALLGSGFSVEVYDEDVHGRQVARVVASDGRDVGVALAEEGLATDRYLDRFAMDHPSYAEALRRAFATARLGGLGLWPTCFADVAAAEGGTGATTPARGDATGGAAGSQLAEPVVHQGRTGIWPCHPAYVHCLPDGPDLDCAEVGHQVLLVGAADPYRLDGNSTTATDGVGCDTFPPWAAEVTYGYERR